MHVYVMRGSARKACAGLPVRILFVIKREDLSWSVRQSWWVIRQEVCMSVEKYLQFFLSTGLFA